MSKLDLEDLKLYQKYIDLYQYTYMITEKFPKKERYSLNTDIKNTTYKGLEKVIEAHKTYDNKIRIDILNKLDSSLKVLKVLVRISYKNKYINSNNYAAWSRKITNVSNLTGGWIKTCLKL